MRILGITPLYGAKLRKSLIALSALLALTVNISPIAHAATAQTITFTQPAAMTVGQADQTLTATASSALTVALATNNTAICTIVAGKLHAVGVGSCIVKATQAGNVKFAAATAVPRTLAISAARLTAQTITFAPPTTLTLAQSPYTLTATTSSGLVPVITSSTTTICTVSGLTLTLLKTGTCTLAANQAGNATYAAATAVSKSITLAKATQTITFVPPTTLTLAQSPYTLTATSSSGLVPVITSSTTAVCTVSGLTLTLVTAGTCSLAANQASNATYAAASSVNVSISLTKATQIIAPPTTTATWGQPPQSYPLIPLASSGLAISYTSNTPLVCSIVAGVIMFAMAPGAICTVTANQSGNSIYSPAPTLTFSITEVAGGPPPVGPMFQNVITFAPPSSLTLGQSSYITYALSASSSAGMVPTLTASGVCSVSGMVLSAFTSGSCVISADVPAFSVWFAAPTVVAIINIL